MADRLGASEKHSTGSLRVLKRRLPIVILCALAAAGAALGFSLVKEKQYTATSTLLLRDPQLDQTIFGATFLAPSSDPQRQAATNVRLASLEVVAARTADHLGGRLSAPAVRSKVVVTADGSSDVVTIDATDSTPALAASLADTFASEYISFRKAIDKSKIEQARLLLDEQLAALSRTARAGPQGELLRKSAQQLGILAAVQTGNAELVQRATIPTVPSSPKPVRNTAVAAVLGILLGVGVAFLLNQLDGRVHDVEEVASLYGMPVLGLIPKNRSLATSHGGLEQLAPEAAEAFRMLRVNLHHLKLDSAIGGPTRPWTLLITSPSRDDGKSTVAWNLGLIAASVGDRCLLIEADLYRPTLMSRHPSLSRVGPGLTNVLACEATLEEATSSVAVSNGPGGASRLDVLASGPIAPNPQGMLESHGMEALLREAEESYDLVIVDTPPTSVVSDALALMKMVGGVLVVSRLAATKREDIVHLRQHLEIMGAPTIGVVVNGVPARDGAYGYPREEELLGRSLRVVDPSRT